MKPHKLLLILFCIVPMFFACNQTSDKTDSGKDISPPLFSPEEMKNNQADLIDPKFCGILKENEYCIRGPWFIQLGENMVWDSLSVPGATIKDTVYEQITNADTFAWNVRIVRFDDGEVILESDFNTFSLLGRVRIEKPGIKSKEGIGVGSTVKDLLETYDSFQLAPYAEMELIELNPVGSSNLYFHIPDPGNVLQNAKGGSLNVQDLDPTSKISRIIIWDNTVGNEGA